MIVVSGGRARNPADRVTPDGAVQPVQRLVGDEFVDASDLLGAVPVDNVSNLVDVDGVIWWSTGSDLHRGARKIDVADLDDVHELSRLGSEVVVANTGHEEALVFDATSAHLVERRRLGGGVLHLNQIFEGLDGRRYGLVHHVDGRQLRKRVAGRLLKVQGDGGVVDLDTDRRVPLRLTAPHSARLVGGEMWVADSGRARVIRYDESWQQIGTIETPGWGRGAVLDGGYLWLGLSPLRRRYEGFVVGDRVSVPTVVVIDVTSHEIVERYELEGVDQINGVHRVAAIVDGEVR